MILLVMLALLALAAVGIFTDQTLRLSSGKQEEPIQSPTPTEPAPEDASAMAEGKVLTLSASLPKREIDLSSGIAIKLLPAPSQMISIEFNNIINGRQFAEKYWTQPKAGGRFYVGKLMDYCEGIRATSPTLLSMAQPDIGTVGEQNYMRASEFLYSIQSRCGQITSEDYARMSGPIAYANSAGTDPLVGASLLWARASTSLKLRREAISAVLNASDPLLMQDIGMRLSLYSGTNESIYIYFDGEKFPVATDPSIVAAYFLLPCGMGLDCASSDVELAVRCLSGNGCYATRFQFVRDQMAQGSETKYADIFQTYERLLAAVKAKSVNSFLPAAAQ